MAVTKEVAAREAAGRRVSTRTVSTADSEAKDTPLARLIALNKQLQALPWNHNEVRRISPMVIREIVEVVTLLAEPT